MTIINWFQSFIYIEWLIQIRLYTIYEQYKYCEQNKTVSSSTKCRQVPSVASHIQHMVEKRYYWYDPIVSIRFFFINWPIRKLYVYRNLHPGMLWCNVWSRGAIPGRHWIVDKLCREIKTHVQYTQQYENLYSIFMYSFMKLGNIVAYIIFSKTLFKNTRNQNRHISRNISIDTSRLRRVYPYIRTNIICQPLNKDDLAYIRCMELKFFR